MDVSALLFDMDDVLYDATVWRRWLLRLLGNLGLHTHYAPFFHVWEHSYLGDVYCGQREYWDAFRDFLSAVGLSAGQIDEVTAASCARRRQFDRGLRAFPGVKSTLARLSASGMPLGILCNSSHSRTDLQRRLAQIGLANHFEFVISSRDVKRRKPQPESYRLALQRFNLPSNRVGYVGHDAIELGGAAGEGMLAIAFNHGPDVEADVLMERFDELVTVASFHNVHRRAAG